MLSHTRKPGSMLNSVVTLGVLLSIARVEAQGPAQGGAAAVKGASDNLLADHGAMAKAWAIYFPCRRCWWPWDVIARRHLCLSRPSM